MTAFDTDVLSDFVAGNPVMVQRAAGIDPAEQVIPVVVAAEVFRGWLNAVRQAEAGRGRMSLELAFRMFQHSLRVIAPYTILPYTPAADTLFRQWRAAKIRVGSQDLRIAAVCIDHGATLVTRNARDYTQVPGLSLDVWN